MKIKSFMSVVAAAAIITLGACSSNNSTASASTEAASAESTEAAASTGTVEAAGVYELPEGEALAPKEGRIMMVDFNADWCVPCQKFRPVFDAAAEKYGKDIDFVSVNMDKHPEIVEEYSVEAFPTIVFIMPDGTSDKQVGLVGQDEFFAKVDEHIGRLAN